jgi:hypothetical protein
VVLSILISKQTGSSAKVVEGPSFTVIGISCRTTNVREAKGEGCIGKQWGRLFGEGVLGKSSERADQNIVAVYTDYASHKDGEYTHVLGAKVADDATPPEGMVKVVVPPASMPYSLPLAAPSSRLCPPSGCESGKCRSPNPAEIAPIAPISSCTTRERPIRRTL